MNSRQRVIGALERRPIDRVPVNLACGGPNSAIDKLLAHFEAKDREDLPVQPKAWGMDHRELKAEFGDRLAFWGGIDVQELLPFGTPEQVRQTVRERIEILGAGGGYILSSSHNLLKAFPLENILAMYDEALKIA